MWLPDDLPRWQFIAAPVAVVVSLTIVSQFSGCIEGIGPEPSAPEHSENVGVDGD